MKMPGVDRRTTAVVSLALFFLSVSRSCLVQGEHLKASQHERQLSANENTGIQTCSGSSTELVLEGANQTFRFACPEMMKLYPPEDTRPSLPSGATEATDPTYRVYDFDPSKKTGCGSTTNLLATVVPGSTVVGISESDVVNHSFVYTLTLGPSQASPKYLCYSCKPSENPSQHAANSCTIYITVPQTNNTSPPSNRDKPSGSGSFSRSVFGCLILGVAGPALALMRHL